MISKCMSILENLSDSHCKSSLADIAKATGIPKTTVFRLLKKMEESGFVMLSSNGSYVISDKLVSISLKGNVKTGILPVLIPYVDRLRDEIHETISVNVVSGNERMCIYRAEGNLLLTRMVEIGSHAPLFFGASGRILAAGLSDHALKSALNFAVSNGYFPAEDSDLFMNKVFEDRKRGYCLSVEEIHPGCGSLAFPIKKRLTNETVAALSISATAERMRNPETVDTYINVLRRVASECNTKIII